MPGSKTDADEREKERKNLKENLRVKEFVLMKTGQTGSINASRRKTGLAVKAKIK
jgi:ribosomal protein L39E